ncbi:DUF2877 domain-containing protein [Proteus alimentorum]|uniref:DUF2877 domain-containing protein n=1 Tax=Proteus alimentorum TaxID=1973495 RepID=UPI000BFFB722|nr:DUF2877 domain-containing protein [Proteus alimentorum]
MNKHTSHRQILYGLTADTHFLELLHQPSLSGTIKQVFNKAINFSINNTLYTLLCSQLDNAPNSCRIINKSFSSLNIKENDLVRITNNEMYIGENYLISFPLCKKWQKKNIKFHQKKLNSHDYLLFLNSQIDKLDLILKDNTHSLFNYRGDNFFYLQVSNKLNTLRSELINSLINQEHESLKKIIHQFVGLGIGLTPSGDDYLVGLMAFLLLEQHPIHSLSPFFYHGIMQSTMNTTPISAITLEKALEQEYRENMYQLIQSLVDAQETNIYSHVLAILNIGSSSGSDMLFGIRDALFITHYFGERDVN